ncbi:winged helix-turn-helix domain-containing protein, partial [Natranaerobius trueperi]
SRIFRLAGTTNSNSGEKVTVQYRHDYRYDLKTDIRDKYLPNLEKPKKKKGRPPKIVTLHNIRNLHYSRALDLIKLVKLRNYEVTGYRETMCFLYRYWQCCLLNDPKKALEDVLEFNSKFKNPLKEKEIITATRSAEKSWNARSSKKANEIAKDRGYLGAGYNYSNKRLIEDLDITSEEQKYLKTIIGTKEKYRRKNKKRREARRVDGMTKRERQKAEALEKLKETIRENPTASQRELAKLLNISPSYVNKLLKQIGNS